MKARNINDDSTLAYLFNKTRQSASDALQKAIEAITNTITTITTNMPQWINVSIGYVSGETIDDKIARLLSGNYLPRGKPFIGYVTSGSVYFTAGYLYVASNKLYGSFIFSSYKGANTSGGIYSVTEGVAERRLVDRAGDTMTGVLVMNNATVRVKTSADPSSATDQFPTAFVVRDKNDTNLGFVEGAITSDGKRGIGFETGRTVGSSTIWNALRLYVDSSGDRVVTVTAAAPWRSALGLGTSGALPITVAQGGTGSTAVSTISTIANIATAGSGIQITSASFASWGKVAHFDIAFKATSAISSGATICTIVSGKRPTLTLNVLESGGGYCTFNTNGAIAIWKAYAANSTWSIRAVYLLAN